MLVTKKSVLDGKEYTMDIPVTAEALEAYKRGDVNIQDAFPTLPVGLREFLISGITPEQWDKTFPDED